MTTRLPPSAVAAGSLAAVTAPFLVSRADDEAARAACRGDALEVAATRAGPGRVGGGWAVDFSSVTTFAFSSPTRGGCSTTRDGATAAGGATRALSGRDDAITGVSTITGASTTACAVVPSTARLAAWPSVSVRRIKLATSQVTAAEVSVSVVIASVGLGTASVSLGNVNVSLDRRRARAGGFASYQAIVHPLEVCEYPTMRPPCGVEVGKPAR